MALRIKSPATLPPRHTPCDVYGEDQIREWLRQCYHVSERSLDPSTRNGAVLVRAGEIVATGWNAFPRGMAAGPERLIDRTAKLARTVHAEVAAIADAAARGRATADATLVGAWAACRPCALVMIAAGITQLIRHMDGPAHASWQAEIAQADDYLAECGVTIVEYRGQLGGCTALRNGQGWSP